MISASHSVIVHIFNFSTCLTKFRIGYRGVTVVRIKVTFHLQKLKFNAYWTIICFGMWRRRRRRITQKKSIDIAVFFFCSANITFQLFLFLSLSLSLPLLFSLSISSLSLSPCPLSLSLEYRHVIKLWGQIVNPIGIRKKWIVVITDLKIEIEKKRIIPKLPI